MHWLLLLLLSIFVLPDTAGAMDAIGKVRRERPEVLDTSATVATRYGTLQASYETDFLEVPLNGVHSWRLSLQDKQGQPVTGADIVLTADMPEHLHGMTTTPQVQDTQTPGLYLVRGMNFHMPGYWEVTLDISEAGSRHLLRFNLIVGENQRGPDRKGADES
ncbi:FixH family protein [Tropicibacter sp. Alg240-R139]|uniref:FixH family protein n=1 Tax=Tropicibacter sp. Alg240-R139 TaxID=2305991 RepID=UPI0013DF5710|nr:FixH family protein [Tropicibacter sp. Alg240-R139]